MVESNIDSSINPKYTSVLCELYQKCGIVKYICTFTVLGLAQIVSIFFSYLSGQKT